jgi:hypothetical protein
MNVLRRVRDVRDLRGTLQQNLHPPFELCASTRGRLENGWSGRRLVGTRKAKSQYIGRSPDPKRESQQHLQLDTEAEVA